MTVLIERYDPDKNEKWTASYEVETDGVCMTVMDILDTISENQDPSLAYYKHSVCNHGICGRCALMVNGRPGLACIERIEGGDTLRLAPLQGKTVVRDLVVDMNVRKN